jgi:hypothetical protein
MKNLLLSGFIILISLPSTAQAQVILQDGETTTEEYKYVIKSYIKVLKQGIPVKSGYEVKSIAKPEGEKVDYKLNVTSFEFSGLYYLKTNKLKAIIIVMFKDEDPDRILCMPLLDSQPGLYDNYMQDMFFLGKDKKNLLIKQLNNVVTYKTEKITSEQEDGVGNTAKK